MASKKPVLKQKTKKKKWFPLYAPALFGGQLIGETHVESSEQVKGKFINTNLSTITNDMKKQNTAVKLRVSKIVEGKGQTEIIGMSLVQSFVKRLVRRGRSKVDDSFTAKTKDGQLVRVKPLVLTNTTCVASTASQLRLETRRLLKEKVASTGFVNSVQDILTFKMQKSIKDALQKIHPIRSVDVRVFERELVRGKVPEADLDLIPEEEVKEEQAEEKEETTQEPAEEQADEKKKVKKAPAKEEVEDASEEAPESDSADEEKKE